MSSAPVTQTRYFRPDSATTRIAMIKAPLLPPKARIAVSKYRNTAYRLLAIPKRPARSRQASVAVGEPACVGIGRAVALCQNCRVRVRAGWRMLHRLIVIAVTLLSGFAGGQAGGQEAIGAVSRIQGEASGTHGGATRPLGLNASVFLNEVVSTGEAARLEVTLADRTRLTLGEKAELTLGTYVFNPAAGGGTIKFGVVGAFRFLSGQVSKLANSNVNVTTPSANIGIRGTEFWGGPIDSQSLGVFLIEGSVSVSNAAGEQILSLPGQGTNIATTDAAPGPVVFWPPDKVNRALATVTFQ